MKIPGFFPGATLRRTLSLLLCTFTLAGCFNFHVTEKQWLYKREVKIAPEWLTEAARQADGELAKFSLRSAGETELNLVHLNKPGAKALVIYFAGAGTVLPSSLPHLLDMYRGLPVNVLFYDYRGYGLSSGEPSLGGLHEDAHAVLRYARAQRNPENLPVIFHGFSLGSVIASELAKAEVPQGLILEGSATNVPEWADNSIPWWAWPFVRLSIDPPLLAYDTVKATRALHAPLLLVTGAEDEITPVKFAEKIRAAHPFPACAELQVIRKTGHGGAFRTAEGKAAFAAFVERVSQAPAC